MPSETIVLNGRIPSKKNEYAVGNKSFYIPEALKNRLDEIDRDMRKQWGMRLPLKHPRAIFRFFIGADNKDRDNMETTLLDCMVRSCILVDDNVKSNNNWSTKAPAVVDKSISSEDQETAIIKLFWEDHEEETDQH